MVERKPMLSKLCKELNNWFDRDQPKFHGAIEIQNGKIADADIVRTIKTNQYFRIVGSIFNDGVYKWDENLHLTDELFVGAVWLMAVPKDVIDLANEIKAWNDKYGAQAASPFSSESFGGYSYTKASGGSDGSSSGPSWQSAFRNQLNQWRKL